MLEIRVGNHDAWGDLLEVYDCPRESSFERLIMDVYTPVGLVGTQTRLEK